MEIDPVVVLAEELRSTESALRHAVRRYEMNQAQENGEAVNTLLNSLKSIYRDIAETRPTSAMGAGELVRLAAQRLPFSLSRYVSHFHEVADRLSEGRREHADLVWLRAMRAALNGGACGEQAMKAAPLLNLAIAGASRPIVVFRAYGEPPPDQIAQLPH
ncbi:MAG TPA: hypothetical protein VMO78_07985 [Rhizomicrobium sp.]|nr:hypothetical protein [Rhizomicrobium sp.]